MAGGRETKGRVSTGPTPMIFGKAAQDSSRHMGLDISLTPTVNGSSKPLPEELKGGWATCQTDADFSDWLEKRSKYSWGQYGNVPLASLSTCDNESKRWVKKAEPVPPAPMYSRLP